MVASSIRRYLKLAVGYKRLESVLLTRLFNVEGDSACLDVRAYVRACVAPHPESVELKSWTPLNSDSSSSSAINLKAVIYSSKLFHPFITDVPPQSKLVFKAAFKN